VKQVGGGGIEPAALVFKKWRRRATFVVNSKKANGFQANWLSPPVPWSPL